MEAHVINGILCVIQLQWQGYCEPWSFHERILRGFETNKMFQELECGIGWFLETFLMYSFLN